VAELALGGAQEATVAGDAQHHLCHTQGDDLSVSQLPPPVARLLRQEIVRGALNTGAERVEVGIHRGLLVDGVLNTADSDLSAPDPCPQPTAKTVESLI
jgi:hypothetical protein